MSGIKELSVDQTAVLALVLGQGRPFRELAGMLDMDEGEMRRRAHAALDALGPDDDAGPEPERRAEVSDYLLGQQSDEQRAQTYRFLEGSPHARAWARVVADRLGELATGPLPEIPDGASAAEPASGAHDGTRAVGEGPADGSAGGGGLGAPRSARAGGALLVGGLAVVAIAAVLFFVLRSGGDDDSGGNAKTTPAPATTAPQPRAQVEAQVNLVPPSNRRQLKAVGVVLVQKAQGQDQIVAAVQGLPTPKRGGYGIWLYSGPGKAQWLGFFASRDSRGRLLARGQLMAAIGDYREVLVTRELKGNPPRPGPIFLRGPIQTASSDGSGG
jgi:hypothetical protein